MSARTHSALERRLINYIEADNSLVNPLCRLAHCLMSMCFLEEQNENGSSYCPSAVFMEGFLAPLRWISFPRAPLTFAIQAERGLSAFIPPSHTSQTHLSARPFSRCSNE